MAVVLVALRFNGVAQGLPAGVFDSSDHSAPPPALIRGPVRFQVLDAGLVRLEYSPSGAFVDAPSVAVINRARMELTQGAKFTAQELQTITHRFRGANLPAWLWSGK